MRSGQDSKAMGVSFPPTNYHNLSFIKTLAAELARYHIRVNCILAGPVDTERSAARMGTAQERAERFGIPMGRIGRPEDIALAAIYLASDASEYVTGESLEVKGAHLLERVIWRCLLANFPNFSYSISIERLACPSARFLYNSSPNRLPWWIFNIFVSRQREVIAQTVTDL